MASILRCARLSTQTACKQLFNPSSITIPAFRTFSSASCQLSRGLLFTKGHEWISVNDDNVGTVGLSAHAQDSLGDIVFVELPETGNEYEQDQDCGVVESVKAVSDIFCPVSGTVNAQNQAVLDQPGLINKSYMDKGWLFKIELSKPEELDDLMNEEAYKQFLEKEE